mgnify:CR=1 FL=1
MRVLLNALSVINQKTGIGEYTKNVYEELSKNKKIDIDLFVGNKVIENLEDTLNSSTNNVTIRNFIRDRIPFSYDVARHVRQLGFNKILNKNSYSIYHEPNFISLNSNIPVVLNIHDLSWISHPKMHPNRRVKSLKKHVPLSLKKSKKIIVDSYFIKNELLNHFDINENDVHVIYLASKYKFKTYKNNFEDFLLANNLTYKEFFICVGTLEPRKNLANCIKSYLLLPKSIRIKYPLIIIGAHGWKFDKSTLEIDETIKFIGYVEDQSLEYLYHGALALLYLSVYEGFGLPPLEAMSCKTVAITSNKGTLKELYADSSISLDPNDCLSLKQNMLKLIEDKSFQLYFTKKGFTYSKNFSWNKTANKVLDLYKEILS